MSAMKLTKPRILRTGSPLEMEAIKCVAPAVFAAEPHDSRGPRYLYVPTIQPLQTLLDNGWGVYEASQQRARAQDRDPYTKHMLRLRKLSDFDISSLTGEGVPEVVLINAHDGTAAYHLMAGYFRFICSNGMMVGTKMAGFKVRHTVSSQTNLEVLDAAEKTVTEKFPTMLEHVEAMQQMEISAAAQDEFAALAIRLRYGTTMAPFTPPELLTARRPADEGYSVWKVLNRIQENIMTGGWETRSHMFNRRSAVRPVERVSAVAKINGGLWDHAMQLVEA
jgi:hypothetical protein